MKKWIAVILCVMLAAAFTGCGCGNKTKDASKDKKTEASADNKEETSGKLNIKDGIETSEDSEKSESSESANNSESSDNSESTNNSDKSDSSKKTDSSEVDPEKLSGTVELGSAEVEKNSEEIIYITASENTPVAAFEFDLVYDTALFEILEYGFTDDFTNAYSGMYIANDVGGETVFTGINTDQSEQYYSGPIAYVKVKCLGESGTSGNISLEVPSLSTYDGTNRSGNFEFKGSTITIK